MWCQQVLPCVFQHEVPRRSQWCPSWGRQYTDGGTVDQTAPHEDHLRQLLGEFAHRQCQHCSYWAYKWPFNYISWWRHQMDTRSVYWPFLRIIHRTPVDYPHKCQWRGALMFSLICVNKRLNKQSERRWFEMPLHSLWCHCNVLSLWWDGLAQRKDSWNPGFAISLGQFNSNVILSKSCVLYCMLIRTECVA